MARKKKLKENVRDEIEEEEEEEERDSSDSDSSGFLTHSTFNESKEQRRNRSSASTPAKATSKSPRKSPRKAQSGSIKKAGKTMRSPLKEKSRNIPGKVRGRPPTSTPLQRTAGRKKLVGTPKTRKFRPGTRALMEIRYG